VKLEEWKHASHSDTAKYQVTCDGEILSLRAVQPTDFQNLGAVKQLASLEQCYGKRVRFNAEISTIDTDAAGLWLTASSRDWHVTDGMYDRLIKGTVDWQSVALVIDVPAEATYVSYGLWMMGKGECRIRNPKFEVVEEEVPLTTSGIWDRVAPDRWVEREE